MRGSRDRVGMLIAVMVAVAAAFAFASFRPTHATQASFWPAIAHHASR